jgi:hypothetical protein
MNYRYDTVGENKHQMGRLFLFFGPESREKLSSAIETTTYLSSRIGALAKQSTKKKWINLTVNS